MLARCYFSTGRLHDAAAIYEQALTEWAVDVIRQWIYESLRLIYQESDLPEKTIELLERWAAEFPDAKGIHMQIAELQAKLVNIEAVPVSVRKEVERNPEADRDWRISTLLVLGETRDFSRKLLSELKSDPAKFNLIPSLLEDYWPSFGGLSNKARDEWISGIYLSDHSVPQSLRTVWSGKAGHAYANAVELELNSKVFSKFRESILVTRSAGELASRDAEKEDEEKVLVAFIRDKYPYNTRSLTLGEMAFVIDHCESSRAPLLQDFKHWVKSNCPQLLIEAKKLNKVNVFRRGPAHGNTPAISPEDVPLLCRKIIDSLPSH